MPGREGTMAQEKFMNRLELLFKEEQWGRFEPRDIGISKFKILDDLFNSAVSEGKIDEVYEACKVHIEEHVESITAIYLIGLTGYHRDRIQDSLQLKKLIDVFMSHQKWAVVELIADKILEFGENSFALRALAVSLERLGRNREAIPILENLLKIDRFDTEVAKKLSLAVVNEDQAKSIHYMKLAIEGFAKKKDYDEVVTLWNKLIPLSWSELNFFERIERTLTDAKQYDLAAGLIKSLWHKYRDEEMVDESIDLLKKILGYRPDDNQARRDLIKAYGQKYGNHSQYEQFLQLSKLNNYKVPVKYAIQDFEKNIVFDVGNYVFHNSWKLGKISDIDSEYIVIDFKDKAAHRMGIQMALQSLMPVSSDHLYVAEYEDQANVEKMFREDFLNFFEILIRSYNGEIKLADIKHELLGKYIDEKGWAKWWTRARTLIKKDPRYGVSEKSKDLIFLRDKPVTYEDDLLDKFSKTDSFAVRLGIAIEFVNNVNTDSESHVIDFFINYFSEQVKGASTTRLVLSYFILKDIKNNFKSGKIKLETTIHKVEEFIKNSSELNLLSTKITSYDYKKDLVNLIEETRDDWQLVLLELLFESPVRIHRYIINKLIRAHGYNTINTFIDRIIAGSKQYPEVFFWVAKNILTKTWDYEWIDYSRDTLVTTFFRLMSDLKRIETDGSRLKNMSIEILFDNESAVLGEMVKDSSELLIGKLYDLFLHIPFIEEAQADKFLALIKERYSSFSLEQTEKAEDFKVIEEKLIATKEGYEKKKAELERMKKVEMAALSKELARVAEVSADVRDNTDYNALLEKQSVLQLAISKLDEEMKDVTILDLETVGTDSVNIGNSVTVENRDTGEIREYVVIGPWDADFEKGILSYRSPIARAFLGKKLGEEFNMKIDDVDTTFIVKRIEKYHQ